MAAPGGRMESPSRSPHSVSLKVLRLSRPTLSTQHPLPAGEPSDTYGIDPAAASTYPSLSSLDEGFILTAGLRLPAAFGSARVGETFACTLCVNNELEETSDVEVADLKITATMQTPGELGVPVPLEVQTTLGTEATLSKLRSAETLQGIVRFHLSDEGNYVLAVTVAYIEVHKSQDEASETSTKRARTFRKLYQFPATQLIRVRIKTRPIPAILGESYGAGYSVEAQLEKLGDDSLVLESAEIKPKAAYAVKSLNDWDVSRGSSRKPMLNPGDVLQAAFLLRPVEGAEQEVTKDGRVLLGQMAIRWRGVMGEAGLLNTGWLSGRRL